VAIVGVVRRNPMTWRTGINGTRMERTGNGANRAADYRSCRRAPTTTGKPADSGAHSGTNQPAPDIELCVRRHCRQ
jgi:hypothetical protein